MSIHDTADRGDEALNGRMLRMFGGLSDEGRAHYTALLAQMGCADDFGEELPAETHLALLVRASFDEGTRDVLDELGAWPSAHGGCCLASAS